MKAAFFVGKGQIEIRQAPVPEPAADQVLVKVMSSGICGSDKGLWMNEGEKSGIHGHEASGVVEAVGRDVTQWRPGDRVAVLAVAGCGTCSYCAAGQYTYCAHWKFYGGGYGEYLVAPALNLLPLPDYIPFDRGCLLLDALGTPAKAARRVGVRAQEWALVMGCGPIGANAILACKAYGAWVIAAEPIAYRREHAARLGAELTLDPTAPDFLDRVREVTRGGAAKVLECSGQPAAEQMALAAARTGGRVVFVGENSALSINPSEDLIRRDITVMGSWYLHRSDYFENLELMQRSGLDPMRAVTHVVSLDEIAHGFDVFCAHKENCLKVVVRVAEA
jgi:propanol-preferring alcohol dehydrogenase